MNDVVDCPYKEKLKPLANPLEFTIEPLQISKAKKLARFLSARLISSSRQLRRKESTFHFISALIHPKTSQRQPKPVVCIPTLAGPYCVITQLDMIKALLKHPRVGEGEILSEGRQLRVIADALGRFRISKERQDMKQKRSILATLLANPTRYLPQMFATSAQFIDRWKHHVGTVFDMTDDLREFTLSIYLQSVMNYQGPIQPLVPLLEKQINLLGQSLVYKKPKQFQQKFKALRGELVSQLIADPGLQGTTDYTKQLSEYIDDHYKTLQEEAFSTGLNGATLAGYLAPAPAFIAAVYELGKNPIYQERLFEEWQQHLSAEGTALTYVKAEDTLLHATIHEILRLHPSQPFVFREAAQDCIINNQYSIAAQTQIVFNFYHLLRDEHHFGASPDTFYPERFMVDSERYHSPFLVYSSGPNNCTGQFFSRLSLKVFLHNMIINFHWKTLTQQLSHQFHFALTFAESLEVRMEKR